MPISLASPEVIEKVILRSKKAAARSASNLFDYVYRAPNGRQFEIREFEGGEFFLAEMRPNGRVFSIAEGVLNCGDEPRLDEFMGDPNGFLARVQEAGIGEHSLVRVVGGLGVATIYWHSLSEVASAINRSLLANTWYEDVDLAKLRDPAFQSEQNQQDRAIHVAYQTEKLRSHKLATENERGIFKGLHNAVGPLPEETKKAILSYINAPSDELWSEISGTCIKGFTTLWQAWAKVDPLSPQSKQGGQSWSRIPSPEMLRNAMLSAGSVPEGFDLYDLPSQDWIVVQLGTGKLVEHFTVFEGNSGVRIDVAEISQDVIDHGSWGSLVAEPGWYWQRIDVAELHGPFSDIKSAVSDCRVNRDQPGIPRTPPAAPTFQRFLL